MAPRARELATYSGADPVLGRLLADWKGILSPFLRSIPSFSDNETPAGVVDGTNAAFRLARLPSPTESLVFVVAPTAGNGVVKFPDVGSDGDYTLARDGAGAIVTLKTAPAAGSMIRCWYRY